MFELIDSPESVIAGKPVKLKIRYIHEGPVLESGAVIRIGYNGLDGAGHIQIDDPEALNYFQVSCEKDVKIALTSPKSRRSITHFRGTGVSDLIVCEITIESGSLEKGDCIDLLFGVENGKGFVPGKGCDTPWEMFYHLDPENKFSLKSFHPDAEPYQQFISADGKEIPDWQSCGLIVKVVPDTAKYADLILPTVVKPGCHQLKIVVYDRYHNYLKNWQGKIQLCETNLTGIGFDLSEFTTDENGCAAVPIALDKPSLIPALGFYIHELGVFNSNPVKVNDQRCDGIYWGELHGHSALSDGGRRGPDDFFNYSSKITNLDFAALADHSFGLAVRDHWQQLLASIDKFSVDDEFIALLGYEIMPGPPYGHRNVYFPDMKGKIVMGDFQPGSGGSFAGENIEVYKSIWNPEIPKTTTMEATVKALEAVDFLWTAHHCGDIADVEKSHLTLYEACSEWGISEQCFRQNTSRIISDLFAEGYSLGLDGGSDDHRAKGGFKGRSHVDGSPTPWPSGLTAVICEKLDRQHLYQALKNKHCYGTTGARILLEPNVEYSDDSLKIHLNIAGTNDLERAWIFKNGQQVWHTFFYYGNHAEVVWEDTDFTSNDNCYIRIKQQDGEVAWINPLPFIKE